MKAAFKTMRSIISSITGMLELILKYDSMEIMRSTAGRNRSNRFGFQVLGVERAQVVFISGGVVVGVSRLVHVGSHAHDGDATSAASTSGDVGTGREGVGIPTAFGHTTDGGANTLG